MTAAPIITTAILMAIWAILPQTRGIVEPIILSILLVWACYRFVVLVRDAWRDFSQTFPREIPGDRR